MSLTIRELLNEIQEFADVNKEKYHVKLSQSRQPKGIRVNMLTGREEPSEPGPSEYSIIIEEKG